MIKICFSILYADIVNFTPLADKFEPPELVNILNKLFAKFDQKAKVTLQLKKKIFLITNSFLIIGVRLYENKNIR